MSGADELMAVAADLGTAGVRATLAAGRAVRTTAALIEGSAKQAAPVDTGNLRNSIGTDLSPDRLSAEIGPTADYGGYVEDGTSRMSPQPYMGPAFDQHAPDLERVLGDIAGDVL